MKKNIAILFLLFYALGVLRTYAQDQSNKPVQRTPIAQNLVPKEVTNALKKEYPRIRVGAWYPRDTYAGEWNWSSDNTQYHYTSPYYNQEEPEFYENIYQLNGKSYSVIYGRYGTKVQTSVSLTNEEIPEAVLKELDNGEYKDWTKMPNKEMVTRGDTEMYKIRVQKGKKKHILFFNEKGKVIQRKKRDEDFHA